MRKDGELRIQARNIRALQRAIRRKTPEDLTIDLLTPHAKWTFFQEVLSDDSNAARYLARASIEHADLEGVVQMVGDNFNAGHIKQAVLSIGTRREALQAWESFYDRSSETSDSLSSADDDDVTTSAWSNFPPKLQKVIRRIKSESGPDDKFYWEQSFLPNLVDPKEAKEGWAEIAIDPQTRKEIREAVAHHQNAARGSSLYGVLSRGHTGGALLYGPPGTGKTQLARVLACESGSVVICASPVDIEHKWAGDMPKSIKGLFNLGRLLSPSIIFIDEADSLFESRGEASPDWRRTIVNQLLSEMDGMSKSKANPFVLLSTNLPGNLDPAVLRRVPTRLYIGLPSTALRLKIFEIVLRDEILHPDVDFEILAFLTPRFSGSDIRSLCVKAAISCDTFVEVGENKGKRLLTRSLFEEAIARTSPSITKPALAAIRGFAKQSDTANLEKIQNMEIEESVIQRDLAPQKLRQTNLGEVQDCDSAGSGKHPQT
jgi:SpoVK/Ycf46/Vps4 family AAA+-type ATPase